MKEEKNKTINTNMGEIPIKDYGDSVAMQNGFDSYEDMKNQGHIIELFGMEEK